MRVLCAQVWGREVGRFLLREGSTVWRLEKDEEDGGKQKKMIGKSRGGRQTSERANRVVRGHHLIDWKKGKVLESLPGRTDEKKTGGGGGFRSYKGFERRKKGGGGETKIVDPKKGRDQSDRRRTAADVETEGERLRRAETKTTGLTLVSSRRIKWDPDDRES